MLVPYRIKRDPGSHFDPKNSQRVIPYVLRQQGPAFVRIWPQKDREASVYAAYAYRKLRQYFQSHHIVVLTNQPQKEVLQKMTMSERMVKWSIELSEFSLVFWPKKAIKV